MWGSVTLRFQGPTSRSATGVSSYERARQALLDRFCTADIASAYCCMSACHCFPGCFVYQAASRVQIQVSTSAIMQPPTQIQSRAISQNPGQFKVIERQHPLVSIQKRKRDMAPAGIIQKHYLHHVQAASAFPMSSYQTEHDSCVHIRLCSAVPQLWKSW